MTGFEKYLLEKGWVLTGGTGGEFSTFGNISNRYENEKGKIISIGLLAQPTRIGIFHPLCFDIEVCSDNEEDAKPLRDGTGRLYKITRLFTGLPVEKDFELYETRLQEQNVLKE